MAGRSYATVPGAEAVRNVAAYGADVTEDVRMDGVYFFRSSASRPFVKILDPGDFSYCVMVRRGRMRLTIEFPEPQVIDLGPGTIVGVSGLAPHRLCSIDAGGDVPISTFDRVSLSEQIDPRSDLELIIGVAPSESIALSNLIIGPVHLAKDVVPECARRIWKAVELLDEEFSDGGHPYGQAIIVRRIAEIILINMSRAILVSREKNDAPAPRLMNSKGVLAAIRAFLAAPLDDWSVGRLARVAGMSRTKFAEEFRRVMGQTPMQTLGRIRLTLIARKLITEEMSVDEAADVAGYSSSAAFIRAFNREFRTTPRQWRKIQKDRIGSSLPAD
ncbi:AraC family transcriptional regulator [Parvibaculum sp.]|uniref:helix-turn-helix transcriptional regulator n=1 Tax=Parvibaculum sp. TaxID=2024848 RepID=UPI003210D745